jgi:hypothetical protein
MSEIKKLNNIKLFEYDQYQDILNLSEIPESIRLGDHLGGFSKDGKNLYLDFLNTNTKDNTTIYYDQILNPWVIKNYPRLKFLYFPHYILPTLKDYRIHPLNNYKNFICSFNGSPHVSRKLLVSALDKFGWFLPDYCSKNFTYSVSELNGHVFDYVPEQFRVYAKFFSNDNKFNRTVHSFGHTRFQHSNNIYNLESKLTESFLHIVSETLATSYHPFVTEKFLYSIVTRGLFLSYAQPGWHSHLEKYYGFKPYTKLFDYRFDSIQNPVKRLVELMSMVSKFSVLSPDDWRDLYLLEQDAIEYNYNHYFSQDYLKCLAKFE